MNRISTLDSAMKRQLKSRVKIAAWLAAVACIWTGSSAEADDALDRLLKRAPATSSAKSTDGKTAKPTQDKATAGKQAPSKPAGGAATAGSAMGVRLASHQSDEGGQPDPTSGFVPRDKTAPGEQTCLPAPIGCGDIVYGAMPQNCQSCGTQNCQVCVDKKCAPGRDEVVCDGSDRGEKIYVDQSWKVYGLDTEDTIGHYDTLDGRRLVSPSNRVCIYAPRFGAVRKLDGPINASLNLPVVALEENTPIHLTEGNDNSSTTKQHVALNRFEVANRASGFVDRTRGVLADQVVHLFGTRNSFHSFENLSIIRMGKFSNAESARLNLGLQSARVWQDNLGLQVTVQNLSPIVLEDAKGAAELVAVESEHGDVLRVTKVASKIAARTGDFVDFTIRYDNLSGRRIGNVTIIDNLTRRLEYVPDSAESSLNAKFISEENDGGSLMLRWEITDPLEPHAGGLVRFRCRVR